MPAGLESIVTAYVRSKNRQALENDPAMARTLHVLALEQYEKAEKAESNAALACRPFFANDNNRTANG